MSDVHAITRLLEGLRGHGFSVRLTIPGAELIGQKVVAVENGLVYTVDAVGTVSATVIAQIQQVEF